MPAGKLLWTPEPAFARKTNMAAFEKSLEGRGLDFKDYSEMWRWSVDDLEGFWGSIWKYFDVADADYPVLRERRMPGARWFEGSELNFTERVFRERREGAALVVKGEKRKEKLVTWPDLQRKVSALSSKLRDMGIKPGDRVAGYLTNSEEAVIA